MTVCILPAVSCDGPECGEAFAAPFYQMPNGYGRFGDTWRRDARKAAKEDGWLHRGGHDYCRRCKTMKNFLEPHSQYSQKPE